MYGSGCRDCGPALRSPAGPGLGWVAEAVAVGANVLNVFLNRGTERIPCPPVPGSAVNNMLAALSPAELASWLSLPHGADYRAAIDARDGGRLASLIAERDACDPARLGPFVKRFYELMAAYGSPAVGLPGPGAVATGTPGVLDPIIPRVVETVRSVPAVQEFEAEYRRQATADAFTGALPLLLAGGALLFLMRRR